MSGRPMTQTELSKLRIYLTMWHDRHPSDVEAAEMIRRTTRTIDRNRQKAGGAA